MRSETQIYLGGFENPVFDAQATFRLLMDGFARPGTIQTPQIMAEAPKPLGPVAAAIALTLCDHDTPVWLSAELLAGDLVGRWLTFHTGCPITHQKAEADFAFFSEAGLLPSSSCFAQGSQEYPDRSTTLVLPVESLTGGQELRLEGPGIDGVANLAPRGLPVHFLPMWQENRARFPRGVDVILHTIDSLVCLPRTTRITSQEDAPCM